MANLIFKIDISALRRGDKKAYESVYDEFFSLLFNLCLGYLYDDKVSEEIVQDTFMKLWEVRHTLNEQVNIRNFLYTIAKNNCLNYLRNQKISLKHQQHIRYLEMQFNYEAMEKLGNYLQFEELRNRIEDSIEKLPVDVRETFKLSRFEELSYKEIAEKQGISIKTVESRISKGLRFMRNELKDYLPIICLISNILN